MMNEELERNIYKLNFQIEKSMRYHQRRRGFYDFVHRAFMFLIIFFGSAAFIDQAGHLREWVGVLVASLAAIDLVWSLSHRARDHEVLFRSFSELAIQIRTTEDADQKAYDSWVKRRIEIETDEPPIYYALEADCDNQVRRAWGKTNELVKIGWFKHKLLHLVRFSPKDFSEWETSST